VQEAAKHAFKNALSAAPVMVALRRAVRGSPFGPSRGMSASEWRVRRLAQLRELVDAYLTAWQSVAWLTGRSVLELGSGDDVCVPFGFCALGASVGYATDVGACPRSSLSSELETGAVALLSKYGSVDASARARVEFRAGVRAESISRDLSGLKFDLIVTSSTLEHVADPRAAMIEMRKCIGPGGRMVHAIAMGNHCCGRGENERLAHLVYPEWAWHLMWSHRVGHNRLRWFEWEALLLETGFRIAHASVARATGEEVTAIRPRLAGQFRRMTDEQLAPSYVVVCCEGR
jgi:SAM-dependent methyltransferase